MNDCTQDDHDEIKRDAETFHRETEPKGYMDLGDGEPLELGNCRRCNSTIAIAVQQ